MARITPDLSRRDWVEAAMSALIETGIESVKVERIARQLDVSKGSFYWHFKNRDDLLSALLEFWEKELTLQLIENSASFKTPRDRLENLAKDSVVAMEGKVDVAAAESALRAWAAQDARARTFARKIDAKRLDYLAGELGQLGVSQLDVTMLSKSIYLTLLGLFTARRYTPELADDAAFNHMVSVMLDAATDKG